MEFINCPICDSTEFSMVLQASDRKSSLPELFTVVQCNSCSMVYQNPRPTPSEMSRYYPESYGPHQLRESWRPSKQHVFKQEIIHLMAYLHYQAPTIGRLATWLTNKPDPIKWSLRKISFFIKPRLGPLPKYLSPGRILEIGCGTGGYLDIVSDLGWQTYGIEISNVAADIATRKNHQIVNGTLENCPWPDEFFQAVCLWHTLEHLHNPKETLRKIRQLMQPDAQLLIEVPNWDSISAEYFGTDWFALELPRHLYFFTKANLERLLQDAGFVITSTEIIPSRYVIEQSHIYRNLSLANQQHPSASKKSKYAHLNWRLSILIEKIYKRGDLLRVTASRP